MHISLLIHWLVFWNHLMIMPLSGQEDVTVDELTLVQVMAWCRQGTSHYRSQAWWRHQIETFSALLDICAGNSPVTVEFPSQRPVTRNFDISLIYAWINGWVNNREAGDLRRHGVHYDVIVMVGPDHRRHLGVTKPLWLTNEFQEITHLITITN